MANSKKKQAATQHQPSLRKTLGSVRTALEWKSDPSAVAWLAGELAKPQWQEVLQILEDTSPMRLNPSVYEQAMAAQVYNCEQGYRGCLANLTSLAEFVNIVKDFQDQESFQDN
jgi:hypothetical protein